MRAGSAGGRSGTGFAADFARGSLLLTLDPAAGFMVYRAALDGPPSGVSEMGV